jgi:carbonic anhydrase/acetyltransferase-like protein (isoleucine patch superfamily)
VCSSDLYVAPTAVVIGRVELGKGANLWPGAVLRGDINKIVVGENTNVQDNAVLHVEKNRACIVQSGVTIGHQATVHACIVESGALIGIGARILNGATVGKYSLIAAGAVVLENAKIPAYSLAAGVPARVLRKLTRKEITHLKKSAVNYTKLSKIYKKCEQHLFSGSVTPINDLSEIF